MDKYNERVAKGYSDPTVGWWRQTTRSHAGGYARRNNSMLRWQVLAMWLSLIAFCLFGLYYNTVLH